MPVPNQFANVTTSIPLSQLDANFNTPITLGNTAIQLGNTVSTLNNMTLANVTVTSGNVTITNVTVTTANVTTANIATAQIANVTVSGTGTFAAGSNTAPSITTSGDTNTGIFFPAADTIAFTEGGVESARFDSSGNFLVGTTSGSYAITARRAPATNANQIMLEAYRSTGANSGVGDYLSTANGLYGHKYIGSSWFGSLIGTTGIVFNTGTLGSETERMRLDSSGNLGLGVTPSAWNTSGFRAIQLINNGAVSGLSGQNVLNFTQNAYYSSGGAWTYVSNNTAGMYQIVGNSHQWLIAGSGTAGAQITFTQAMTLDAGSNLAVGRTDALDSYRVTFEKGNDKHLILNATTSGNGVYTTMAFANQSTAKAYLYWYSTDSRFYVQNNTLGVYLAQNGTAWTSNSDERLKTDLTPITDAVSKVVTLRTVTGRFIEDEETTSRSFLIAQDVQAVFPQAVDADDPEKLGVRYTDTIPLLIAAIKELNAKVEAQAAEIVALKGNA